MNDNDLLDKAVEARYKAYAPYSGFKVGAALLCEDGTVFTGANIENAVYSLSICAERVAVVKAASEGYRRFKTLAVIADGPAPCSPCGACRQFLAEFGLETSVIMANTSGEVERARLSGLLPSTFTNEQFLVDINVDGEVDQDHQP